MRMRAVRSLVFACVSVVGCLVILSTVTNTTPASPMALHTLVTNTHNHLNHLHNNIKEEFQSLVSTPDPEILHKLGFIEDPVLYPHTNWTNLTTPVIATAVQGSEIDDVSSIVSLAVQVCASATILVYTLDVSQKQLEQVESLCNDTCSVVPFDHSQYPSHVRNWRLRAYRPIIIQELLIRAGAVLWLDPSIRLVNPLSSRHTNSSGDRPVDGFLKSESQQLPSAEYEGYSNFRSQIPRRRFPKGRISAYRSAVESNNAKISPSLSVRLALRPSSTTSVTSSPPSALEETEGATENSSSLQTYYPADQASVLNLEDFVPVKESENGLIGVDGIRKKTIRLKNKIIQNSVRWKRYFKNHLAPEYEFQYTSENPANVFAEIHKRHPGDDILDKITLADEAVYPLSEDKQYLKYQTKNTLVVNVSQQWSTISHGRSAPSVKMGDGLISLKTRNNEANNKLGHLREMVKELSSVTKKTRNENILGSDDSESFPARGPHLNYAHVPRLDADGAVPQLLPSKPNTIIDALNAADVESLLLLNHVEENSLLGRWDRLAQQHQGLLVWPRSDPVTGHLPTAALTHPGLFSAMHTPKHLYDFHQMSDPGAVLVYNTPAVHLQLMKPWLMCSLTHHCIQPIGAQDTGCRFDKKPLFRYSGCHLYDTSAFNVALGLMIGPNSHPFQPPTFPTFTRTPLSSPDTAVPVSTPLLETHHLYHPHRVPVEVASSEAWAQITVRSPSLQPNSYSDGYHSLNGSSKRTRDSGTQSWKVEGREHQLDSGPSDEHLASQAKNSFLLFNHSISSSLSSRTLETARDHGRVSQLLSSGNFSETSGTVGNNKTYVPEQHEEEDVVSVHSSNSVAVHLTRSRRGVSAATWRRLSQQSKTYSKMMRKLYSNH